MHIFRTNPFLDQRGAVAIEAAIVIPLLFFLMLGMVEIYQYFRVIAVVDRAAFTVGNSLAVQPELKALECDLGTYDPAELCSYARMMPQLMQPLDYDQGGLQLQLQYYRSDGDPAQPAWQPEWVYQCSAGAQPCQTVATIAAPAQAPAPLLDQADDLLVITTQAEYTPFSISSGVWSQLKGDPVLLSSRVYFRPRHGGPITLDQSH